jgi:hypothetical protein
MVLVAAGLLQELPTLAVVEAVELETTVEVLLDLLQMVVQELFLFATQSHLSQVGITQLRAAVLHSLLQ